MNKKVRLAVIIILIVIMAFGIVWYAVLETGNAKSNKEYEEAAEILEEESAAEEETEGPVVTDDAPRPTELTYTDPVIDELRKKKIDRLKMTNEEVIGWIYIPDTVIEYPVMQGKDNSYYLKHTWKNTESSSGAIFMETGNSKDFSDFNTLLYGHNMRSGMMFGSLKEYANEEYFKAHPYVYIVNSEGVFRYDIFAAHKVRTGTIVYAMDIEDIEQRKELISFAIDYSDIKTDITPTEYDSILTLSTCSDGTKYRFVVQAVLNDSESYRKSDYE